MKRVLTLLVLALGAAHPAAADYCTTVVNGLTFHGGSIAHSTQQAFDEAVLDCRDNPYIDTTDCGASATSACHQGQNPYAANDARCWTGTSETRFEGTRPKINRSSGNVVNECKRMFGEDAEFCVTNLKCDYVARVRASAPEYVPAPPAPPAPPARATTRYVYVAPVAPIAPIAPIEPIAPFGATFEVQIGTFPAPVYVERGPRRHVVRNQGSIVSLRLFVPGAPASGYFGMGQSVGMAIASARSSCLAWQSPIVCNGPYTFLYQ